MTRYDVTVSNFLWIADCCIMRTFSVRIIRIFFEKYVRIFTYFILSYAYPRTLALYINTYKTKNLGVLNSVMFIGEAGSLIEAGGFY